MSYNVDWLVVVVQTWDGKDNTIDSSGTSGRKRKHQSGGRDEWDAEIDRGNVMVLSLLMLYMIMLV
jgi:hypothetical protein